MKTTIIIAAACFLMLQFTWLHYLAIMRLKTIKDEGKLNKWAYRFGMPILLVGYLSDFVSNMIPLTILMLEPPREWLVSARVSRHQRESADWADRKGVAKYVARWRYSVSKWTCSNLLDPFDPSGCHCKE